LATVAVGLSGRAITDAQQTELNRRSSSAMGRILLAATGARDPTNTYVREIPRMGIERVWRDVSTAATPDISDLNLTDDAANRVLQGLQTFQRRFENELARLVNYINRL
jgi:hypothetical protein